ncbi:SWIM zinc finger family protein [uncultured Streptomyces sp.]|uniref:SWIM zinc finger family protein n=1 Tax=uncultured Streptomyces sp. TaxID=174707 RepID=UPI00262090BA|nr:SWIM zinc finger family protein [uncultured Streptomyces sp.]
MALAPDETSRRAGAGLGVPGAWSGTGHDATGAVWGSCEGGGGRPYRTAVDTGGPAYTCSCPSRKSPCKHALGLLLLHASDPAAVPVGEAPEWASARLHGRPDRTGTKGAPVTASATGDPEAARRRAERRAARVTAGVEELAQRLADLVRGGFAASEQSGDALWQETAARMVDAQAPGLASRVRDLGALPASASGRPDRLLEECALVHLLATAWLGRDRLPGPLAATVRTRIGLPSSAQGIPVRDHWTVLSRHDVPDGRLVARRTWLHGRRSGRAALLLSFGAPGRAPAPSLPVGTTWDAEVTPYPGGSQYRVELGGDAAAAESPDGPPPGVSVAAAVAVYGGALVEDPWLASVPVVLDQVIPVPSGDGWQLADEKGESAVPIAPAAAAGPGLWRLVAVSGGGPLTVFGELGHRGFDPLATWSPTEEEGRVPGTVPLG